MSKDRYHNIPAELRERKQWVAAHIFPSKRRPGRTDKVPVNPATNEYGDSSAPSTWGAFDAALDCCRRGSWQGIGFVFTADDPYIGIDFDEVIDAEGNIEQWALDYLRLCNSYAERSQSGTGLHIIARGKLPPGGRKKGPVEMYDSGRFFVFTGDVLPGYETIGDAQEAIVLIHREQFGAQTPRPEPGRQPAQPVDLDDADLIARATGARNGHKFEALWHGNIGGYPSQSEADLAFCSAAAFWTGGDAQRIDRLYRQSGLMRGKWDERHYSDGRTYGEATIDKALRTATGFYHDNDHEPAIFAAGDMQEPPGWLDDDGKDASGAGQPPAEKPTRRRKMTSAALVDFLMAEGYSFRLNLCDDSIEVNGERITDVVRAQMRCKLRDAGLGKFLAAADDAVTAQAAKNAFHPVRAYLEGLTWNGDRQIAALADHFKDQNSIIELYLRKWLIGAIRRAYTGAQNAVFVLDGPQGLGKSQFVRWLCPLPRLFVDANINPDDKDTSLLAMRSWIWEVSELGATTKRADMEALKGFLSREVFTLRPAYAHFEIVKPGLASFIGTVNNSSGIFSDPTGSRRYWTTTVTDLDWSYARNIDVNQVWAEAFAAYQGGESSTLTPEEAGAARAINETYAVADPVEDLLRKHFQMDPGDRTHWTSSADILTTLQANGLGNNAKANAMYLSGTLKRLGFQKHKDGDINGYWGVWF